MTIKFSDITGGGIPYGNNAGRPANPGIGKLYSNGEAQRLELYTGAQYGWQNIIAETPGVIGYSGSVLETNSNNTITITGTNFASGAIATLVGTDGTEYTATTTTVNNLTNITAVFGAIPANKEPYDIRVTNPSNLYGVYYDILTVNDKPSWQTAAGSLGSFDEGSSVSITLSATDEENNTITYSSSNLPAWLSLNSSTGALTGNTPTVSADTTYSFNVIASDGINTSVSRAFSITSVNIAPVTSGIVTHLDASNPSSYSGSGSVWYDISGNGNNATLYNGVSYSTSGSGGHLSLDGSNGYIQLSSNSSAAPYANQNFTIDMWVYRYQESEGYEILWSQDYTSHAPPYYTVHIRYDNPGTIGGSMGNPSGVLTGVWQHWVFTKTASTTVVYLNGQEVYNQPSSSLTYYNNPLWIGKSNFNTSSTLRFGSIRYYNRALSSSEALRNFSATRDRFSV